MSKPQAELDFDKAGPTPSWEEIFPAREPIMKPLRDYQLETLTQFLIWYFKGEEPEALIALATGLGKTLTATACIRNVHKNLPKHKILWVTHRDELVRQSAQSLENYLAKTVAIEKASQRAYGSQFVVASVQSLKGSRLQRFSRSFQPDLIVFDEAHHSIARSWMGIKLMFPQAKVLNLTATPFRSDIGQRLELGKVLIEKNTSEGIEMGFLVPPKPIGTLKLNLGKVGTRLGDYKQEKLERVLRQTRVLKDSAKLLAEHSKGRRSIVFAASVDHGQELAQACRQLGLERVYEVYGTTPLDERKRIYAEVEKHPNSLLLNNLCLTEGFDLPALDLVAIFRPTKSAALYIQMLGRGLRKAPNKEECLVIDAIDISKKAIGKQSLYLPTEEDVRRETSLLGRHITPCQVLLNWLYDQNEVMDYLQTRETPKRHLLTAEEIFKVLFPAQQSWLHAQASRIDKLQEVLDKWDDPAKALQELANLTGCRHPESFVRLLHQRGWRYYPKNQLPNTESQDEEMAEAVEAVEEEQSAFSVDLLTSLEPKLKNFLINVIGEADLGKQAEVYYDIFPVNGRNVVWFRPINTKANFHFLTTKETQEKRNYIWVRDSQGNIHSFSERKLEGVRKQSMPDLPDFLSKLPTYVFSDAWAKVPMTEAQKPHLMKILKLKSKDLKRLQISKLSASALMTNHFFSDTLVRIPLLLRQHA